MLAQVKQTIDERSLFSADDALLLMVSGGSDSSALAYLIAQMRDAGEINNVAILHVDHKLRGEASDLDAIFVEKLATHLNIPFFKCEIDIAKEAQLRGENIEAVARQERYLAANEALVSLCQHTLTPIADGKIVTAHTRDDRIENFYMRSIVGTGPGGFRSMKYVNGSVVRPLLDVSREELRLFISESVENPIVDEEGHFWREDATNAHTDRFRAYVRHQIIPKTTEWLPTAPDNLVRTMNLIADEDEMLDVMSEDIIAQSVEAIGNDEAFLLKPQFGEAPIPLQRRVIRILLKKMLGGDERIDTSSIEAVLDGFETLNSGSRKPKSGYVANIQGNLAISSNKSGVRIEPMDEFRRRRKKI